MVLRHVRWTQHCSHLSMRQVHWGQGPVRCVSGSELSTRDRHSSLLQLHVLCPVCFKSIPVNQTIAFCEPFLVSNEPVSVTPESERFLVSSEPVSHSHRSHRASLKYQTGWLRGTNNLVHARMQIICGFRGDMQVLPTCTSIHPGGQSSLHTGYFVSTRQHSASSACIISSRSVPNFVFPPSVGCEGKVHDVRKVQLSDVTHETGW